MAAPTLTNLLTAMRRDPSASDTTAFPDTTLIPMLVEGALDLARRGKALPLTATFSAVAGASKYVLAGGASPKVSNFLSLYWESGGIVYTDASGTLKTHPNDFQIVSEAWLDLNLPAWRSLSANDTLQYVFLTLDASGNLNLGVSPPTLSAAPSFAIHYLSRGTDMVNGGDYPWVTGNLLTHLEPFMKGIVWYALWRFHDETTLIASLAEKYMQLYLALAEEMAEAQDRLFTTKLYGLTDAGQSVASQTFGGL